jgi:hypothetical protein
VHVLSGRRRAVLDEHLFPGRFQLADHIHRSIEWLLVGT